MRKFIVAFLLSLSIVSYAQTPVWMKIANEGDIITGVNMTLRFGLGACWSSTFTNVSLNAFTFSVTNFSKAFSAPDPCPNIKKEIDVQQTNAAQSITVNGKAVVVPPIGPPASTNPSITLNLTGVPIPVVLNGTKYSCTSVVLDNTGTLTLTC